MNYTIANLVTTDWFSENITQSMLSFIWNKKPARIKNDILYNDIEYRGLRMTNFDNFVKAQKFCWINRLIENKDMVTLRYLLQFLPPMDYEHFQKSNMNPDDLADIPELYRQMLY